MPKCTLTSNAVSYDLKTLLGLSTNPVLSRLQVQFVPTAVEAANTLGSTLKIAEDSGVSTSPDLVLIPGEAYEYPWLANIPSPANLYLRASVNNAVIYVSYGGK